MIEDDGVGFDVDEASSRRGSHGLSGLRERVALMGGIISIRSFPQHAAARKTQAGRGAARRTGTAIVIELPVGPRSGNGRAGRQASPAQAGQDTRLAGSSPASPEPPPWRLERGSPDPYPAWE